MLVASRCWVPGGNCFFRVCCCCCCCPFGLVLGSLEELVVAPRAFKSCFWACACLPRSYFPLQVVPEEESVAALLYVWSAAPPARIPPIITVAAPSLIIPPPPNSTPLTALTHQKHTHHTRDAPASHALPNLRGCPNVLG